MRPCRSPSATRCREPRCAAIERTRARGGRVIAVGTSVVRALEDSALRYGVVRAGVASAELILDQDTTPRQWCPVCSPASTCLARATTGYRCVHAAATLALRRGAGREPRLPHARVRRCRAVFARPAVERRMGPACRVTSKRALGRASEEQAGERALLEQVRLFCDDAIVQRLKPHEAGDRRAYLRAGEARHFGGDLDGHAGGVGEQLRATRAIHGDEPECRRVDRCAHGEQPWLRKMSALRPPSASAMRSPSCVSSTTPV